MSVIYGFLQEAQREAQMAATQNELESTKARIQELEMEVKKAAQHQLADATNIAQANNEVRLKGKLVMTKSILFFDKCSL